MSQSSFWRHASSALKGAGTSDWFKWQLVTRLLVPPPTDDLMRLLGERLKTTRGRTRKGVTIIGLAGILAPEQEKKAKA